MSQYPSPYQQPHQSFGYYGGDPYASLKGPARRASLLMFILGGLLCACGFCCIGAGPMIEKAQLNAQQMAQFNQLEQQVGFSMQTLFAILGGMSAVPGLILIILGVFVRRGGMGPVMASIVITSLLILGCLFFIAATLVEAAGGGGGGAGNAGDALPAIAVFVVVGGLLVLLLVWLIQAARNASQISAMHAQYQMQYWQYQQQQQAYQQQHGTPPPPAAPPPPPQ